MRALQRMLLRDLASMVGPVVSIALVVTCGVSAYVTLTGTWDSLLRSRDTYYASERFGHVFAHLERAPDTLARQLAELPGVAHLYTRVVEGGRAPLKGGGETAQVQVVSIPDAGLPPMNGLRLSAGRMPRDENTREVLLLEAFAEAHGIRPGDSLEVVLGGRQYRLSVAGLAMSPEFVFAVAGNAMAPEPEKFAVVWMRRTPVANVFDLEGSFNDVVLRVQPGASRRAVIGEVDRLLAPYGGLGAVGRDRQLSNLFLEQELMQLQSMATFAPVLFLAVAAFLLNVVMTRLVQLQRPQIATLKAIGYGNGQVGRHYLSLALLIVLAGTSAGLGLGAWLGRAMVDLYTAFFRMPLLQFRISAPVALTAVLSGALAAVAGSWLAVRSVTRLSPAEAMRPAAPPRYRKGVLSRAVARLASPAARMVLREVSRRPLRLMVSTLGIGIGLGILVLGRSFDDAMTQLVDGYLQSAQREDLLVSFDRPLDPAALRALAVLPGVRRVEPLGAVPVRFAHGPYERTSTLHARGLDQELRPLLDDRLSSVAPPTDGIALTRTLAELLRVRIGDTLSVEPLEGDRQPRDVRLVETVPERVGLQGHMEARAAFALLGRPATTTGALLRIDPSQRAQLQRALVEFPRVSGIARKQAAIDKFREQSAESLGLFAGLLTAFAMVIAAGVVYNNARVTLSLRSRDLASLRVLGFTRAEVAQMLLSELAVQVVLALPVGLLLGTWFAEAMMSNTDPELYRLGADVSRQTYAFACLVTLAASAVSGWLIYRRLQRLDLIAVLKTRE